MSGLPRANTGIGALLRDFYAEDETDQVALRRAQEQREAQNDSARQLNSISTNFFGGKDRNVPAASDPVKDLEAQRALRDSQRAARTKSREQSDGAASLSSYLQRQGVSPEDAEVMARNPRMLQSWDAGRTREGDRAFRREESDADRAFRAQESARNRASQRELFGQRQQAAQQQREAKAAGGDTKAATDLRKEFNNLPIAKRFTDIRINFDKINRSAKSNSAAGDLSLIYSFMKLLDSGSVVKEGEFANAQNAAGVPDRVRNIYNKALSGQRLTPEQRQSFVDEANEAYAAEEADYSKYVDMFSRIANDSGIDASSVIVGAPRRGQRNTPEQQDAAREIQGGASRGSFGVGGAVRMRNPDDGMVYEVDASEADEAAANGWEAL